MRKMACPSSPTVLHVAPVGSPASGLTYSIPTLVRALRELGVATGLLVSGRHAYTRELPYPVVPLRSLPLRRAISAMPSPLDQPDLIVFHSTYILKHAFLTHQARELGIPYIITPRGGMTRGAQQVKPLKKRLGNLLFFRSMVHHAAAIHCLTDAEARDALAWKRPVFVVGNGIDLPPTEALAEPGQHGPLRFVFLGRLDAQHKGLDLLIEAVSLAQDSLRRAGAEVHLYGPDIRGSRAQIEQMVIANHLQRLVHIHGPTYGSDKESLLRSTDVFLHTSRFEGHPMAVLEALAYGVPCLLTPGTNLSLEVASAGAGWAAGEGAQSIAESLCAAAEESQNLAARGIAARRLAEASYAWPQVGQRLLESYLEVLGLNHVQRTGSCSRDSTS